MTDSITPPPEMVQQWDDEGTEMFRPEYQLHLAARAAQWGADQELEACCKWLLCEAGDAVTEFIPGDLRAARRPKPPSLKEQALLQLDTLNADLAMHGRGCDLSQIRRALEALPE
jgi:hypothetical protein